MDLWKLTVSRISMQGKAEIARVSLKSAIAVRRLQSQSREKKVLRRPAALDAERMKKIMLMRSILPPLYNSEEDLDRRT